MKREKHVYEIRDSMSVIPQWYGIHDELYIYKRRDFDIDNVHVAKIYGKVR